MCLTREASNFIGVIFELLEAWNSLLNPNVAGIRWKHTFREVLSFRWHLFKQNVSQAWGVQLWRAIRNT